MLPLHTVNCDTWSPLLSVEQTWSMTTSLEAGNILYFPHLAFDLESQQIALLTPSLLAKQHRAVSFHLEKGLLRGVAAETGQEDQVRCLMHRFSSCSYSLIKCLFPHYEANLIVGEASLFLKEESTHERSRLTLSVRQSVPTRGCRVIKLYSNSHPANVAQHWLLGDSFEHVLAQFSDVLTPPRQPIRQLLGRFGWKRFRRSLYDHYMRLLQQRMLMDQTYQQKASKTQFSFPGQTTWLVFGDQVPHAVLSSPQYVFEHTFYLPSCAQRDPALSPLYQLESVVQESLV